MRTQTAVVLIFAVCFSTSVLTQAAKKPCAKSLSVCPSEGCGEDFDPGLNKLKNITALEGNATARTLESMKGLDNPSAYEKGGSRAELGRLGERDKITVVAHLITSKREGGESCNCGLGGVKNTDNHLVLVSKETLKLSAARREKNSITAEITPRVRLAHPMWNKSNLDPMIRTSPKKALLVRLTGMLIFDSEHFLGKPLVRVNNWEIHPILKFEYCTKGHTCKVDGSSGWRSLDSLGSHS